jgi:hypothetical protein
MTCCMHLSLDCLTLSAYTTFCGTLVTADINLHALRQAAQHPNGVRHTVPRQRFYYARYAGSSLAGTVSRLLPPRAAVISRCTRFAL